MAEGLAARAVPLYCYLLLLVFLSSCSARCVAACDDPIEAPEREKRESNEEETHARRESIIAIGAAHPPRRLRGFRVGGAMRRDATRRDDRVLSRPCSSA